MSRNLLLSAVFLVGLLAACWVGIGHAGANPLGAAVALLIAACYCAGAFELYRYRQATAALGSAVADTAAAREDLPGWLQRLPAALRNPVRLRIAGERIALPAPTLTPYLVGLLVLLGMLGTLLGMMATLRGTGLALESAADLDAIRGSLAAPVKGLAFAFGTSIAGVATSAMLGLLAALCRRERLAVVQQLDAAIAGTLRPHSHAHQREAAFDLQRRQSELLPVLVERLDTLIAGIEQRSTDANAQLQARQDDFHARTEAAYTRLADSLQQSLQASATESARAVGSALLPLVETTMGGLARESATLHAHVTDALQRQLDGVGAGIEAVGAAATTSWNTALDAQRTANDALTGTLRDTLDRFNTSIDTASAAAASSWNAALDEQRTANATLADDLRTALDGFNQGFEQQAAQLLRALAERVEAGNAGAASAWSTAADAAAAAWTDAAARQDATNAAQATRQQSSLDTATSALQAQGEALIAHLQAAHEAQQATLASRDDARLAAWTATFDDLRQSHVELQDALEARDMQRLGAWTEAFGRLTGDVNAQWTRTGEQVVAQQQQVCDTLARTAQEITTQAQAHAAETIAEIARLVQVASEAPKAAADVVAELRQKLSDSMVRDTAMLDERARLLGTLETLLDAVNHASTEQRAAVDALVGTTSDLLERVGNRFVEQVQAETGKLDGIAAQLNAGAIEVASLGEAFGAGVQAFGTANEALGERLQQVASALDGSLARSDDQLAYYVAQAREVVDLSVLSQKQIIEELQQLSARSAGAGAA